MNNRTLLIILVALGAFYLASQFLSGNRDSSFETELIKVDTSKVTSINIKPKDSQDEISLNREGNQWIVSKGTISAPATESAVKSLLNSLALIKTKRITAKSPDKWAEYEVETENGLRVKAFNNGQILEDFIVGRFSLNQQNPGASTSFVRLTNQDEVYAVDGLLSMTFGQGFDSYRNRNVVKLTAGTDINSIKMEKGDSILYTISKTNGQWVMNNGTIIDSTKMVTLTNGMKNVYGTTFADDFDELGAKEKLILALTINGDNFTQPVEVDAYYDTTMTQPFVIKSNMNQAYFGSDSTGIYDKLFKPVSFFVGE